MKKLCRTHCLSIILIGFGLNLLSACSHKEKAALLVTAKQIQTMDSVLLTASAMVINEGKVLELGTKEELLKKYEVTQESNYDDSYIYAGLIDAHCHFYGLGRFLQMVDLTKTSSLEDVVAACVAFDSQKNSANLLGRGWDQSKWNNKKFPNNSALNKAFPNKPVILKRVDGHAALVNNYALELAGLNIHSKIDGGALIVENGQLTGVLIDNAVDLVEKILPKSNTADRVNALLDAQKVCLQYGLTAVTDAGLDTDVIWLIDSLQKSGSLKIKINAMVSLTDENLAYWLKRGPYKTDLLQVNSFKMYGDGALGSRGACLIKPYSDEPNHTGFLLTALHKMEQYIAAIANSRFQLNTHAIGDSTNRLLLKLYGKAIGNKPERRWRIEHAQVVDQADFQLFKQYGVVASVQPTHATSDMFWADERLGSDRIKGAYAYADLLAQLGWLPLGTDFPVEDVSPFYTFFAAVERTDKNGMPKEKFQYHNGLTREQALKGMTIWAAKGAFQEKEMGTLLPGTAADFVVLDINFLKSDLNKIRETKAKHTFINGKEIIF
ncbi:MAG: amidohydrolase [bacterium]|nr:amidohydrolase [bacterium]